jgi:hypothetical protein
MPAHSSAANPAREPNQRLNARPAVARPSAGSPGRQFESTESPPRAVTPELAVGVSLVPPDVSVDPIGRHRAGPARRHVRIDAVQVGAGQQGRPGS